jgi:23S rRNA (pseudouridine1915-N3)-methyltransferase
MDDYTKRLSFYIKFDLEIIPDICEEFIKVKKDKEGELILAKVNTQTNLFYWMKRKNF